MMNTGLKIMETGSISTVRETEMSKAINLLRCALIAISDKTACLKNRLSGVSMPKPTNPQKEIGLTTQYPAIIAEIRDLETNANTTLSDLNTILEDLEL